MTSTNRKLYKSRNKTIKLKPKPMLMNLFVIGSISVSSALAFALDPSQLFPPTVKLDYGEFIGSFENGVTSPKSFLNIPYAAPPVGPLRFMPPQPPGHVGTRQATAFGNGCMQNPRSGFLEGKGLVVSEDCLNLNVFVPPWTFAWSKKPVVVYVYGGGFDSGYASNPLYDGRHIFENISEDNIIVTFNYRVGPFGFLASPELQKSGALNAGLLDQEAVFKWVRKYIALFGGDSTRVTAFGQSAGAISIGSHLVAKAGSSNLFDRAILHSGGPALVLSTPAQQQGIYDSIAQKVNCSYSPAFECLQSVPAEDLYVASKGVQFMPVVDGTYTQNQPLVHMLKGETMNIPVLINNVKDEGTLFTAPVVKSDDYLGPFLKQSFPFLPPTSLDAIQRMYNRKEYEHAYQAAGDIIGDFAFQCPGIILARSMAKRNLPVFRSQFTYPSKFSSRKRELGVWHGTDLPFSWSFSEFLAPEETNMSRIFARTWSLFSSTKNAEVDLEGWTEFQDGKVYTFGKYWSGMTGDYQRSMRCTFWVDTLLTLQNR